MIKSLILTAFLLNEVWNLEELREEEFETHLNKSHVFLVACPKKSKTCERTVNNMQDEWENFNFKNSQDFPSQLFQLVKSKKNEKFYNLITSSSKSPKFIYVEHKNG